MRAVLVLPLACAALIALLQYVDGGSRSVFAPLLVLPVVWAAFVAGRRGVLVLVAATALTLVIPIVLVGEPDYPSGAVWRAAVLTIVAAAVGLATERVAGVAPDRSARAEQLDIEPERAGTDRTTGLPNRASWNDQLVRALAQAARSHETVSVVVCDAGAALVGEVAECLRAGARAADLLARIGGDEFALLLPGADRDAAVDVMERLIANLRAGESISVGIAEWDGREPADELVARADARMLERRRRRRGQGATAAR